MSVTHLYDLINELMTTINNNCDETLKKITELLDQYISKYNDEISKMNIKIDDRTSKIDISSQKDRLIKIFNILNDITPYNLKLFDDTNIKLYDDIVKIVDTYIKSHSSIEQGRIMCLSNLYTHNIYTIINKLKEILNAPLIININNDTDTYDLSSEIQKIEIKDTIKESQFNDNIIINIPQTLKNLYEYCIVINNNNILSLIDFFQNLIFNKDMNRYLRFCENEDFYRLIKNTCFININDNNHPLYKLCINKKEMGTFNDNIVNKDSIFYNIGSYFKYEQYNKGVYIPHLITFLIKTYNETSSNNTFTHYLNIINSIIIKLYNFYHFITEYKDIFNLFNNYTNEYVKNIKKNIYIYAIEKNITAKRNDYIMHLEAKPIEENDDITPLDAKPVEKNDSMKYLYLYDAYLHTNINIYGPYDNIYLKKSSEEIYINEIYHKMTTLLQTKNAICLFGLGMSGVGKTSILLGRRIDNKLTNGLIVNFFNDGTQPIQSDISVETILLYNNTKTKKTSINFNNITKNNIDEINTLEKKYEANTISITYYIYIILTEIVPIWLTYNNPQSSRGHIIINISFIYNSAPKKLIICDLAGYENKFECDHELEQQKFYTTMLNTIKNPKNTLNSEQYEKYLYQSDISNNSNKLDDDSDIMNEIEPYIKDYVALQDKLTNSTLRNTAQSNTSSERTSGIVETDKILEYHKQLSTVLTLPSESRQNGYFDISLNDKIDIIKQIINTVIIGVTDLDTINVPISNLKISGGVFTVTRGQTVSYIKPNHIIHGTTNVTIFKNFSSKDYGIKLPDSLKKYNIEDIFMILFNNTIRFIYPTKKYKTLSLDLINDLFRAIKKQHSQGTNKLTIHKYIRDTIDIFLKFTKNTDYTTFISIKEQLQKYCNERLQEGNYINRSLNQFKNDLQIINNNKNNSILNEKYISSFCRLNYFENDYHYNTSICNIYNYDNDIDKEASIMKAITDLSRIPINEMQFIIINIFSTEAIRYTPPNTLYIDINKLKHILCVDQISNKQKKIDIIRYEILKILKQYYYINSTFANFISYSDYLILLYKSQIDLLIKKCHDIIYFIYSHLKNPNYNDLYDDIYKQVKELIIYIDNYNSNTIVGSLENADILFNKHYKYYSCKYNITDMFKYINIKSIYSSDSAIKSSVDVIIATYNKININLITCYFETLITLYKHCFVIDLTAKEHYISIYGDLFHKNPNDVLTLEIMKLSLCSYHYTNNQKLLKKALSDYSKLFKKTQKINKFNDIKLYEFDKEYNCYNCGNLIDKDKDMIDIIFSDILDNITTINKKTFDIESTQLNSIKNKELINDIFETHIEQFIQKNYCEQTRHYFIYDKDSKTYIQKGLFIKKINNDYNTNINTLLEQIIYICNILKIQSHRVNQNRSLVSETYYNKYDIETNTHIYDLSYTLEDFIAEICHNIINIYENHYKNHNNFNTIKDKVFLNIRVKILTISGRGIFKTINTNNVYDCIFKICFAYLNDHPNSNIITYMNSHPYPTNIETILEMLAKMFNVKDNIKKLLFEIYKKSQPKPNARPNSNPTEKIEIDFRFSPRSDLKLQS